MSRKDNKKAVVLLIRDKKDVLFSKIDANITAKIKKDEWKTVLDKAKELGVCPTNRDEEYMRDKIWGQWKKRTKEKFDSTKKTGEEGGSEKRLSELDNLILDVIGRESPEIIGLDVPESFSDTQEKPGTSGNTDPASSPGKIFRKPSWQKTTNLENDLKIKKLKLEIELLEIKTRKEAIELFETELGHNLNGSKHTAVFHNAITFE